MDNLHPEQHAPAAVNVTVAATRKRQVRHARPREYLTDREIEKLMDAAVGNRWGHRDATAILLAYRHGLRASELVALMGMTSTFSPASKAYQIGGWGLPDKIKPPGVGANKRVPSNDCSLPPDTST